MGNMKKGIIVFGAVAIALLMVSSATAVQQVNSKPVIGYIKSETESLVEEAQENFYLDINQYFQDSFDLEGFFDYLVSDEFIDLLNDNYNLIVSHEGFEMLYNMELIQSFLQSEEFINFMYTDEVQYIIDNLDIGSGGQQGIFIEGDSCYYYLPSPCSQQENYEANAAEYYNHVNKGAEATLLESLPTEPTTDLVTAWLIILIGIITWIPGVILLLLTAPLLFLEAFGLILFGWVFPGGWIPGAIIGSAVAAFLVTLIAVIFFCVTWPASWPLLFGLVTTIAGL